MKALIAMSGGVDSSVAAFLMQQAGHQCIGVTMRLFDNADAGISREKSCCSLEDVEDARSVAYRLGMPFYVFNFTADFGRQVMDRFVDAYECGRTPNPCIDCNRYLKFGQLYCRAQALGYDWVVTGHYARIRQENGRWLLMKALDPAKDQTYFLYAMTQDQLAHTRYPLGEFHKDQVREIAAAQGFLNARKRDSQDICFVPDGDYARVIALRTGKEYPPGDIVDPAGHVVGRHKGLIRYTVGQRKGLGLAMDAPVYVLGKDLAANRLIVGPNEALFSSHLEAEEMNWIAWDTPPDRLRVKAKIRSRQEEQWATVVPTGPDTIALEFDRPQRAISPGQAVVLYDGDVVVGGGTIARAL